MKQQRWPICCSYHLRMGSKLTIGQNSKSSAHNKFSRRKLETANKSAIREFLQHGIQRFNLRYKNISVSERSKGDTNNGSKKLKDGHYEMALPWKNYPPSLENNKRLADHRSSLLKKRLQRNPAVLLKYTAFMEDLFSKGLSMEDLLSKCSTRAR